MSGSHIEGDVERHRVCDKHIIKVAEPSPAVTVVNLSTRGLLSIIVMVPSDLLNIWEDDTTLTAYLPPSGCRIVQRYRCPPNHPVVGMTSGISENMLTAYLPLA